MNRLIRWVVVATTVVGTAATCAAQTANQQTPQGNPQTGYTLQAHAREVVTDVTVTDNKGNPIHGLSESAFHIFDNGKPQRVDSFVEHTAQDASAPFEESPANVYSNDIVLHPPRVFNIILLDTISIRLADQMYLRQQLDQFAQKLPPDQPFAIFARNSEHVMMLANFTADHQKLTKAINYELPRFTPGVDRNYATDMSLMEEICSYVEQYPGRKNVLWFNGGSPLVMGLTPDPTTMAGYVDLRPLYDALEKARVALYPIDSRGLLVVPPPGFNSQELLMEDEADATGGRAIFNNNGLADATRHIADSDSSYYTLAYSPQEVKLDNRWHKVKVEIDGTHYQLSYRRGYYDDGSNLKQTANASGRKQLLQKGETAAQADLHTQPIIFQVRIKPVDPATTDAQHPMVNANGTPPKKGERAYLLHYSVPMDAFPVQTTDGNDHVSVGLAVLAFNKFGRPIARVSDAVTLGVSEERVAASGTSPRIGFDQKINLPDGEDFLYIGLWNTQTGRLGTVQIPFVVTK